MEMVVSNQFSYFYMNGNGDFPTSFHVSKEKRNRTFHYTNLVCGFNPFEKYARQIGNHFPSVRGENKKYLSCHHLVIVE